MVNCSCQKPYTKYSTAQSLRKKKQKITNNDLHPNDMTGKYRPKQAIDGTQTDRYLNALAGSMT